VTEPALTEQVFDIVISGGGLAGCLMALSVSDLKNTSGEALSIAIIESNKIFKDTSLSFDDRVLALSHGTASYFESLGAWQTLKPYAEPIKNIHISDQGYYGKARLYAEKHQVKSLGYVVEMAMIGKTLLSVLKAKTNITWFTPDNINDITWHPEKVDLTLASKSQLSAKLLLGCDGAQSVCRQFANIKTTESQYNQSALIANVATAIPHDNIAFERFTETGPIAMLPLSSVSIADEKPSSRCSLVWTLTPEQAKSMAKLDDDKFKATLEKAFGSWLGEITHVGKRDIYPLKLVQAQEQIYHRLALIGNASHTIHPIAGQGFNLGVRDVSEMAALINEALNTDRDIGQFSALSDYAKRRKVDHQTVINLTDSLVTLFSNKLPPLVLGRSMGLKVLNYCSPLKKVLVKKTMGY
jgi:2-octaprenyl-6-methoxyphenol hydroxylase